MSTQRSFAAHRGLQAPLTPPEGGTHFWLAAHRASQAPRTPDGPELTHFSAALQRDSQAPLTQC